MKIKLFSANLEGHRPTDEEAIKKLEKDVNSCLSENPSATIEWRQTTAASSSADVGIFSTVEASVRFTTLTAIVTIL